MSKIYVHYGSNKFDKTKFNPIKNIQGFTKPRGGLWASAVDAKYGWRDWNYDSRFVECVDSNSFKFRLNNRAKVLTICSPVGVARLPQQEGEVNKDADIFGYHPDWEEIAKWYDAVEVYIDHVYWALYGWDCDSILVLNSDIIVPID